MAKKSLDEIFGTAPSSGLGPTPPRLGERKSLNEIFGTNVQRPDLSQMQIEPEGERGLKGLAVGAGKGVLSTVSGIGELGQKGLRAITSPLLGGKPEISKIPEQYTTPVGKTEKIGFGVEQIGEFFIPASKVGKLSKATEGVIQGMGLGKKTTGALKLGGKSAIGALEAGGITGLQSGGDLGQTSKAAQVGLGLPLVGKVLSPVAKRVFETLPKRLIRNVVGQSKAEILAGKDVSEYVLKTKKVGTADKLIRDSSTAVKELSEKIQAQLDKFTPKTTRILKNDILGQVTKKVNQEGGEITSAEVSNILENLAPQIKSLLKRQSLSLPEANKLRQALDQTLGDKGFLVSQLPYNKTILKAFDDALREKVKKLAPPGTREMFEELSKEITLRNALMSKYATQGRNEVLNGFDLIFGGTGFVGAGLPGAIAAVATKKAIQSPFTKTAIARGLNKAARVKDSQFAAPLLKGITVKTFSSDDK